MRFRVCLLLAIAPLCLSAQQLAPGKAGRIGDAVSRQMSEASVPGVTVAIGSADGLYWDSGFGMADLENMVPATALTRIRLASISKSITATAVMQLVERGKMELDAPIQKYVPAFPQKQWPVTVRQLLGHLSGIRHYASDEEVASTRHYLNRVEPLKIFQDDPLKFEPGTQFSYTTYGFNLLGAAVEIVSGKPFEDYLRENIFEPAGMHSIGLDDGYAIIPHRSRGYELTADKQIRNCGLADTSNKVPGGGLISTAGDLVRFALALNSGKLVKSESTRLMFTAQTLRDGKSSPYGMGWGVSTFKDVRMVAHSGGQQGTSTMLLLFPDKGLAVAVMMNREGAPAGALAQTIAAIMQEP
ncbi:MAG: beta-lactamase family protein [Acidobacteriota bacterium]|nr:beta-lactamase family protein [Acidobacteriota bacterium]